MLNGTPESTNKALIGIVIICVGLILAKRLRDFVQTPPKVVMPVQSAPSPVQFVSPEDFCSLKYGAQSVLTYGNPSCLRKGKKK